MRIDGKGNILQLPSGNWRVRLTTGKDPITGKLQRASRTVRGTKADARRALEGLRKELETGISIDSKDITFGEWAEIFHARRIAAGEVTKATLRDARYGLDKLNGYLYNVRLLDIKPSTIENLHAQLIVDYSHLSGTSRRKVHVILRHVLQGAVRSGIIPANPCADVKAPKADEPSRKSLTQAELMTLVGKLDELGDSDARTVGVRLVAATGCRRGEALGLTWANVDFERKAIFICQQYTNHDGLSTPKSAAGTRRLAIDDHTLKCLRVWKDEQRRYLEWLGTSQTDDTPVVSNAKGGFYDPRGFDRWWREQRKKLGFSNLTIHELRHTQATLFLGSGVDVVTVARRLGHADVKMTLNTYAHAIPENDGIAADTIGSIFKQGAAK